MTDSSREIDVIEHPEVPALSIMLGYGPMLPFAIGAVATWRLTGVWRGEAILLTMLWAAAILAFLAGVRRGLSFRTEGGPAPTQFASMFVLFVLALASLVALVHALAFYAVVFVLIGFVAIMLLDPIAARMAKRRYFLPGSGHRK